jgi:hypothetical protein
MAGAGLIGNTGTLLSGAVSTFPYNQGFETGPKPGLINELNWGSNQWGYKAASHSGSLAAGAAITTTRDDTRRLFVNVDFSGKGCTSISYWYKITSVDTAHRLMRLIGSTNSHTGLEGDGNWFVLMDWTDISNATSWTQFSANLNLAKFNNQSNCYIKIQVKNMSGHNQRTVYIDDFRIETSALPHEAWNVIYDSGHSDRARAVAVDASGDFVYVTGSAQGVGWCTIKYNSEGGGMIWIKTENSGSCIAIDIAVDSSGYVYVVGDKDYYDNLHSRTNIRIIKYDSDGNVIWDKIYDNYDYSYASGVAVDRQGNVYVAGNRGSGYITIKYDSDGNLIWARLYADGGEASGVAVDFRGCVCVTGSGENDTAWGWCTIEYTPNGDLMWSRIQECGGFPYANDVAVDLIGNVYVAGAYNMNGYSQFRTIMYDRFGHIMWERRYGGENCYEWNWAESVAVDSHFNVYVTGYSGNWNSHDEDYRTIKYDHTGNVIWNIGYDSGSARSLDVAVDSSGNAYVTGYSGNWPNSDYRTIKYT